MLGSQGYVTPSNEALFRPAEALAKHKRPVLAFDSFAYLCYCMRDIGIQLPFLFLMSHRIERAWRRRCARPPGDTLKHLLILAINGNVKLIFCLFAAPL